MKVCWRGSKGTGDKRHESDIGNLLTPACHYFVAPARPDAYNPPSKADMQKISVIAPCCNEEIVLPGFFERMTAAAAGWGMEAEFLCVDDGSNDRTWELLKAQHAKDPRWRCLSFARNFGHQAAVSAGLHFATGDAAIIIDADLQDPPEEIARLLAQWRAGFDVVFATRKKRKDPPLKRILAWGFYRVISRLARFPLPADAGDFCLLDKKVVAVLNALPERNRYLRGLRTWCGFKQTSVEFERGERAAGVPQYTFKKSLRLAMDGIFSFSTVPLRLATWLGLAVSACAFLGAAFTFCEKVFAEQFAKFGFTPGPHGIPTMVISLLFLGGVQLICLGILGEYIGRIYDEVKGRPLWILRDSAGIAPTPPTDKKSGA
jgi:glycosyltransferase involved in cell wall biosynthesis